MRRMNGMVILIIFLNRFPFACFKDVTIVIASDRAQLKSKTDATIWKPDRLDIDRAARITKT